MTDRALSCRYALLPGGWAENITITMDANGLITSVEPDDPQTAARRLPGFVLPGMPNLHSHGFQYLMAGLTGPDAGGDHFWSWRERMYAVANRLNPRQYEDCLSWVYLQMLQAGYTGCAEFHYLHHQPDGTPYSQPAEMSLRVLAAAERSGMPVMLLPVLYQRAGFANPEIEIHQRRFRHGLDAYLDLIDSCRSEQARNPLLGLGLAPHSLRAVSATVLKELLQNAPGDLPVHIHVAEQPGEVADCVGHTGLRPVNWLLHNLPVNARWCLVHATHMTDDERSAAAASGAVAGLCPSTEADLGDGFFDLGEWIGHEGGFGIGSDSNVRISVAEELRLLEYGERLRRGRRNVLAVAPATVGETLYARACEAGARAMGQAVGSLAPGRRADLVELDGNHPLLEGLEAWNVLDAWVFSGGAGMIRSVRVAGRPVIENGRHRAQEVLERGFRAVVRELRR